MFDPNSFANRTPLAHADTSRDVLRRGGASQRECTERALGFKICFCKVSGNFYGTIATPTSARIVERVTVGSTSACRTILRSSLLVVFLVAPDPVFHAWVLLVSTAPNNF
ncbi:hypothetical protein TNCV_3431261 [Trichonephila clavipes]|nr:hypothetical protein TNCV_3431261 [Trichonephila clavipes]